MRPHTHAGSDTMAISARHTRLTDSWAADVEVVEAAIGRFTSDPRSTNNCQVAFFEVVGDGHLHVNVTHPYKTKAVDGWAGPGELPDGFVHNRTFRDTSQNEMIRQIRDMVFAPRA
jgi:hypothetical protein